MNKKSRIIITITTLAVVSVATFAVLNTKNNLDSTTSSKENAGNSSITESAENSPTSPTTASEKEAILQKNEPGTMRSALNGKQQIIPVIVYADVFGSSFEISAYAPVVETGGNCVATITNDASGESVTKQSSTTPGATTTDCDLLVVLVSQLGSGKFSIVVSYSSDKSEGTSSPAKVSI